VPWKLADAPVDAAYVGLSYGLRQGSTDRRFVTCCSQVFDADGAGLEFVAYETDDFRVFRDNPFLSRSEMRRVMARSLSLYQRRHAGRTPSKVVVYKSTEFQRDEVAACLDAWPGTESVELLQVQKDTVWRGIDIHAPKDRRSKKGVAAGYPCDRGVCLPVGDGEALLWTQGNAGDAVDGRDFFKEGKGIPAPVLLRRFAGHSSWEEAGRLILGLTKMNWNNDGLYDRLPVTLSYAQDLANVVKRAQDLSHRPYQVRFFM
jgi:argonaute-like protein implicated in RNA metabolism and viral defense